MSAPGVSRAGGLPPPGRTLGTTDVDSRHTALRENVSRIDILHQDRGDTPHFLTLGRPDLPGRTPPGHFPAFPESFRPRWVVNEGTADGTADGTAEPVIPDSQHYQNFEDDNLGP